MNISTLITPARIACHQDINSKIAALKKISQILAKDLEQPEYENKIFDSLYQREKISSTAVGNSAAIPHGSLGNYDNIIGVLIILTHPIDFESFDNTGVDILFAVLAPEKYKNKHVKILSNLAKLFNNQQICNEIRQEKESQGVLELICQWEKSTQTAS